MVRYDDDSGRGPGPDGSGTQIKVDIGGLHDFATAVRGHVDGPLRDEVDSTYSAYGHGVRFGPGWSSRSGDMQTARLRYHSCLSTTSDALTDFLENAQAMMTAADEVARRYGDADALAAASTGDIDGALSQAYTAARRALARERTLERRIQ